jgi:hypothetical protein
METQPTKGRPRDRTSWNIAAQQAYAIAGLLRKATNAQMTGDLLVWRLTLQAIRESVNYGLTKEERIEMDKMEASIAKIKLRKTSDEFATSYSKQTNEQIYFALRNYQRRLLDLLNSLGFFPSKEDRSKLTF